MSLRSVLEAAAAIGERKPLHFIFHTGHVGSTLLSRLLDESGCVLSLREPLPLRTLADAHDVLELPESLLNPRDFDALEQALLNLWSRGYRDTHSVVLKATSSACRIAARLLERRDGAHAVYLNLAAEPYLATLLAGRNSGIDLRGHAPVRIRQLQARIETPLPQLHALSLGELAAMSWLAETWNQHDAVARLGARVMALDFDELLADVAGGVGRVAAHFQFAARVALARRHRAQPGADALLQVAGLRVLAAGAGRVAAPIAAEQRGADRRRPALAREPCGSAVRGGCDPECRGCRKEARMNDVAALTTLGRRLLVGDGMPPSPEKAVATLRDAAARGERRSCSAAVSLCCLGCRTSAQCRRRARSSRPRRGARLESCVA